jgi:hypothetical protein
MSRVKDCRVGLDGYISNDLVCISIFDAAMRSSIARSFALVPLSETLTGRHSSINLEFDSVRLGPSLGDTGSSPGFHGRDDVFPTLNRRMLHSVSLANSTN